MGKVKYTFEDFIKERGKDHEDFYRDLHACLTGEGYMAKVDQKKTGYFLSYIDKASKKTLLNVVSRKKGSFLRLYGDHSDQYMDHMRGLRASMVDDLKKGLACKRMVDSSVCNPRCKMGIPIMIDDQIYNKCRNSAMFFFIEADKYEDLKDLISCEVQARSIEG